jgi:hypothetical protein
MCEYTVTYSNPTDVDCDTIFRNEKKRAPPAPICGKGVLWKIDSVSASDSSCPLQGLKVSETVATVPKPGRCSPPDFVWKLKEPCEIGPGGQLTGCTDILSICKLTRDIDYGGCEEVVTQDILVGGKPVEKHTITFELDKQGDDCKGTVTRK